MGGFENFCRMIGGTLSCAGIGGFLANVMDLYERMDLDTPQWEGFLDVWREVIGDSPITVANLIARINQSEELAAALPDTIATRDSRDYSRRVGNALAKRNEMRLPNGLMVTKAGNYKHAIAWRVVSYQDAGTDLTHQKQLVLGSGGELGELDSLRSWRSPEQDACI